MSVVNILAISKKPINWIELNAFYQTSNFNFIEIFPIPSQIGFESDAVGINVPNQNKEDVIKELILVCKSLLFQDYLILELYDSTTITHENIYSTLENILSL